MNAAANRNDLNATEHWFQVALAKGIQPDSAMLTLAATNTVGGFKQQMASPMVGVSLFIYALGT